VPPANGLAPTTWPSSTPETMDSVTTALPTFITIGSLSSAVSDRSTFVIGRIGADVLVPSVFCVHTRASYSSTVMFR
jgi:hypothetical protein